MVRKANKLEYKVLHITKEHLKEFVPATTVMKITHVEMQQIACELAIAIENSVSIEPMLIHILKYRGLM